MGRRVSPKQTLGLPGCWELAIAAGFPTTFALATLLYQNRFLAINLTGTLSE